MVDDRTWMPTLFIAGAPKSGTSSVFRWLADHPESHGSTPKETCFFADPGSHVFNPDLHVSNGIDALRAAFHPVPASASLILEATATSIYSRTALNHIPELPNLPRCLFILREPAAQITSTFTYLQNNWNAIPASMTFPAYLVAVRERSDDFGGNELAAGALENARYVQWLRPWRARLGPDRMKVCTFEMLLRDPRAAMRDLASWLGINPAFYDTYDFASENESYAPVSRRLQSLNIALRGRWPKGKAYTTARRLYRRLNTRPPSRTTDTDVMARLRADFKADNQQLAEEFGLDLSEWS